MTNGLSKEKFDEVGKYLRRDGSKIRIDGVFHVEDQEDVVKVFYDREPPMGLSSKIWHLVWYGWLPNEYSSGFFKVTGNGNGVSVSKIPESEAKHLRVKSCYSEVRSKMLKGQ